MTFSTPAALVASCQRSVSGSAWLSRLPSLVRDLTDRWSLALGEPFDTDTSCAWVAPAARADGTPVVLKLGVPHMESEQEIDGLRFWNGDPTVRLLESDDVAGAMLLERCVPGISLRSEPEPAQDLIVAKLLRRLWRVPPTQSSFRPLEEMTAFWRDETLANAETWLDEPLIRDGLRLLAELPASAPTRVLLATDLHAGNILAAEREPWLVIDPKPFVGDPAYDLTQHLLNCSARVRSDPMGTIDRFSDLAGVDAERVRLWMFARTAAEPREQWVDGEWMALARIFAP